MSNVSTKFYTMMTSFVCLFRFFGNFYFAFLEGLSTLCGMETAMATMGHITYAIYRFGVLFSYREQSRKRDTGDGYTLALDSILAILLWFYQQLEL